MQKRAIFSLFLMICTQTSCVMIYHYSVMDKKSRIKIIRLFWWGGVDSNHRSRRTTDLQSVPFGHSGTSPYGAGERTWTINLLITNQLLCRLSYTSTFFSPLRWCPEAESNHRHRDFQSLALPAELSGHVQHNFDLCCIKKMATWKGLEPSTSSVTG